MTQNSAFTVQLVEKIGAPLVAAIEAVPLQGEETDVEAAKIMAQMLGQAVQVSIALSTGMNLNESEEQADSTRLALASLAAPLMAESYRQNERVPQDQEIKRITKSLEAALAFSDNFTPAAEQSSRLTTVGQSTVLFDKTQVSLVVMQALTPVMAAIAEFPFGQSETKLLQDVSETLKNHAAELAVKIGAGDKLSELLILKSLAQIYTDCHRGETARLATASDESRGELSLAPVWDAFNTRLLMVEILTGMDGENNVAPQTAPQQQEAAPAQTPSQAPPQNTGTAGPMGFFKPGTKTLPPETESAPAPPAPQAPATSPPPPPPTGGGGPMSFFKPGDKPDDKESSE